MLRIVTTRQIHVYDNVNPEQSYGTKRSRLHS